MSDQYRPPKKSTGDIIHAVVKGGISEIPVVGGAGAELFAMIVTPPLEQRRADWMDSVGQALAQLEQKINGFSVDSLKKMMSSFHSLRLHLEQRLPHTRMKN